jgi:hypothetical protein
MAWEFLGTFTASQFTRFSAWIQAQVGQIPARIQHLQAEQGRIGGLAFSYDSGGTPTSIAASDPSTYIGRLFQVYEALGGDAEFDLQVRSMSQPVFKNTGTENRIAQTMSNGEVVSAPGLTDAPSGESFRQARDWAYDVQFYRRDLLERKIRRAVDYVDSLQNEINQLNTIMLDATQTGSIGFILNGIQQLVTDRMYIALVNDTANPDPHGKGAYGPILGYMPNPDGSTTTVDYGRGYDGEVVPTGTPEDTGT